MIPVFDIGRVLIEWDPRHLYRTIFADPAEMAWFLTDVVSKDWIEDLDRGRDVFESMDQLAGRHPRYDAAIRAFHERWDEMVPGVIEGTVAILEGLRRSGTRTYAITNFADDKFARTVRRFPVLGGFDGIVVSAREGLIKPDPAIFHRFLERYGLAAGDCLFVDDIAANVEAARSVGMQAVQFVGPDPLREALAAHGVTGL